jgi:TPR repeat protein
MTTGTSFPSAAVSWLRSIGVALCASVLIAGAAGAGEATNDTYQAALSYRDAVHGSAAAQADLGFRYADGRGLPQSDDRALHWLGRAAQQGYAAAELELSEFYAAGRGTARNDVTAYKWAFLAAVHSGSGSTYDRAMAMIDTLSSRMSPSELAAARRLVDGAQPEPRSSDLSADDREQPDVTGDVSKPAPHGQTARSHRAARHDGRRSHVRSGVFHFARPWGF